MQISKWGNSLAIRIPVDVARALQLKDGDEVDFQVTGERTFEMRRRLTPAELIAHMASFKLPVSDDGRWKLTREEMNGVDRLL